MTRPILWPISLALIVAACSQPGTTGDPDSSTTQSSTLVAPTRTTTGALPSEWPAAEVTHVVDGDTIDVRLESGSSDTLRLIGIN